MNLQGNWAFAKAGIKVWSAYRFEGIVMMLSTPISLIIYYFLWKSIYAYMGTATVGGFAFPEMVNYYILSMIVGFVTWSEVDKWMENDLIWGRMITGLLKPISFITWYMSFEIGINLMNILWQMIPVFLIGFVFFGLRTTTAFNTIAFLISIVFAFFIYFGMTYCLGLTAFWLKRIAGLRRLRRATLGFFSGSFIPLTLFPAWSQTIFHYLPFEYTKFVPITIYLGTITKAMIIKSLAIQLLWIAIIYFIAHLIWKRAIKRYASVGL
ncbi:MAG: ABC-2 family transporter protein [Candidatus Woesearchaeota archaeon]|nr:ABC-2 family transporter protein [Candidatus Woesearchaeota archaeon]